MKMDKQAEDKIIEDATQALDLLREWLSISESQICSTEVLTEQLPKINTLLETSMDDISTHFGSISSHSEQIGKCLKHMEEAVKTSEEKQSIANEIESIASNTTDEIAKKQLLELAANVKKQTDEISEELGKANKYLAETSNEISQIVMGMQFQDRVSQNIMITVNIMKAIVSYLDKEIGESLPSISREERRKLLDKEFAQELLENFRLGELKKSFVDHLIAHGYIKNAEDIGFADDQPEQSDDDIDLF